jgi:hypothetical protein
MLMLEGSVHVGEGWVVSCKEVSTMPHTALVPPLPIGNGNAAAMHAQFARIEVIAEDATGSAIEIAMERHGTAG